MSNQESIDVLYASRCSDELDAAVTSLEQASDRLTVAIVSDVSDGLECLAERGVDWIVSGYQISGTSGLDFLETIREIRPHLPFIYCTDDGSEAVASSAISAGVTDYVRKEPETDHWEILIDRILDAVDEYWANRTRYRVNRRLQAVFDHSPDGMYFHDETGTISDVNQQA